MSRPSLYVRRPLEVGDKVRLTKDGPTQEVLRVSPGAAYVGRAVSKTFTVTNRVTGEEREITRTAMHVDPISPESFVFPGTPETE